MRLLTTKQPKRPKSQAPSVEMSQHALEPSEGCNTDCEGIVLPTCSTQMSKSYFEGQRGKK